MENNSRKKRKIEVCLTDKECLQLAEKAGLVGLTVGELLSSFINDLVCGSQSNGSDEESLANDWYICCYYYFKSSDSLLSYLLCDDFYYVQSFIDTVDEIAELKECIADAEINPDKYEDDIETMKERLQSFSNLYFKYVDGFLLDNDEESIDINKEISICRKWLAEYNAMTVMEG